MRARGRRSTYSAKFGVATSPMRRRASTIESRLGLVEVATNGYQPPSKNSIVEGVLERRE
jgi:hypothetical protein